MKKKILLLTGLSFVLMFTGCKETYSQAGNNAEKDVVNSGSENEESETSIYDTLTEKQKNYLSDVLLYSEDAINMMEYESINWELLGTGFELYNQSSGLEKFGTTYKEETVISDVSNSDKLITISEAKDIRMKGTDIRLEDFADYKYELTKREEGGEAYFMDLPIVEYEDTYVRIAFKRENGNVVMKAPNLIYKNEDSNYVFSLLYNEASIKQFFEKEPKYTLDDKMFMDIQYSSVTDNSLVIEWWNWSEEEYILSESYELYEVTEEGEKLIDSYEGKESDILASTFSISAVKFNEGITLSEGTTYMIKYGKNKEGYLYEEMTFHR